MTPEQLQELDDIKANANYANYIGEQLVDQLVNIATSLAESEKILRDSLTDVPPPPPPPPTKTYQLSATSTQINEGEAVTVILSTTNVPAGVVIPFIITGSVDVKDLVVPSVKEFLIGDDGKGFAVISAIEDKTTEGDEFFTVSLDGVPTDPITIIVKDTSITPEPSDDKYELFSRVLKPFTIIPRNYLKDSTTYERWQEATLIDTDLFEIQFRVLNGSSIRPFKGPYKLLVDNVSVSESYTIKGDTGYFNFNAASYPDGLYTIDIVGAEDESTIPLLVDICRNPDTVQKQMWVIEGSYDNRDRSDIIWAKVPAKFSPSVFPEPYVKAVPFNTPLPRTKLYMFNILPKLEHDVYRTRLTLSPTKKIPRLVTANRQNYTFDPVMSIYPDQALLDGPAGVASIAGATDFKVGRNGSIYFLQGQRFGKITTNKEVITFAGLRSKRPAPRNSPASKDDFELVGDWSNVKGPKYFHETWGMDWITSSLQIDETSPLVLNNGVMEHTHKLPGPQAVITDSQNNRVMLVQFDAASHEKPVVLFELITNMSDPWDIVVVDDLLYVTERLANRISVWDKDGKFVKVLTQGPSGYATIGQNRNPIRLKTLTEIQAQKCIMPEGLVYNPKTKIFTYGSFASGTIRKVHKDTGEDTLWKIVPKGELSGGLYMKLARSDGTFGPEDTIFVNAWSSNAHAGLPTAYLPDGSSWGYMGIGENAPGLVWHNLGYGSSCFVKDGMLICSSSEEGVYVIRQAQGEKVYGWDEYFKPALDAWTRSGYYLVFGRAGISYYGLPLPWNSKDKNIINYLLMHGHQQP